MLCIGQVIDIDGRRFLLEEGAGIFGRDRAEGGFGEVFAAREITAEGGVGGPRVAVKCVNRERMREYEVVYGVEGARELLVNAFERETAAFRAIQVRYGDLRRVNIVGLVHCGSMHFDDQPDIPYPALVFDFCTGSLSRMIARAVPAEVPAGADRLMTREGIAALLIDILTALQALELLGFRHRDIKPANLLEIGGRFVLADLGNLKFCDGLTESVGAASDFYVAPELWDPIARRRSGDNSPQSVNIRGTDVYSLGVTVYNLLTGRTPSNQCDKRPLPMTGTILRQDLGEVEALASAIARLPGRQGGEPGATVIFTGSSPAQVQAFGSGLHGLLLDMLRVEPTQRPDAGQLLTRVIELNAYLAQPPRRLPAAMVAERLRRATGKLPGRDSSGPRWLRLLRGLPVAAAMLAVLGVSLGAELGNSARSAGGMLRQMLDRSTTSFKDCSDCPTMILVAGGRQVARSFAVSVAPISQRQFSYFVDATGWRPEPAGAAGNQLANGEDDGMVSAEAARFYAAWLALKTGQPYRLVSSEEWDLLSVPTPGDVSQSTQAAAEWVQRCPDGQPCAVRAGVSGGILRPSPHVRLGFRVARDLLDTSGAAQTTVSKGRG